MQPSIITNRQKYLVDSVFNGLEVFKVMLEFSFSADGIAGLLYTLCEARWTAAEDANFAHLQQ